MLVAHASSHKKIKDDTERVGSGGNSFQDSIEHGSISRRSLMATNTFVDIISADNMGGVNHCLIKVAIKLGFLGRRIAFMLLQILLATSCRTFMK